ncbi:glutathione S-transferase family protein [Collimonas pratensis]|uniref:Glutathione S-transferase, C-terminal domain protein n=1 Tax=Collimonas pratensis TaxID=279113 RepID=A0ABM5Z038_9BURK|nr:glutathione S-transferase family protein [Collimonas pratensis]AMP12386.1 glutathione S-transferase, C-terminal domain protein [Collimonas pratensis]
MLKILGKASSINVRKVLWTCDELGLPFEREDWGSGFRATDSPDYLALNPNAMVPVIRDGDFVLWESNAIIRYLATAYGDGRLLPAAPRERARVEQWMDWQATELNNSWRYAFVALVRKNPDYNDAAALAASLASWSRHIGILEQQLAATSAYVLGDRFTLADVPLGLSVNRWLMTPMQHADYPAVSAYFERLSLRPGFLRHGRNGLP